MRAFTVGTRGSALALWQTRHVTALLSTHAADVTERIITTQGDINLTERLQGSLEKGFFTQELEAALHQREIDWAVHSLKDLPTRMPKGLCLGAILKRASPADLLIVRPEFVDANAVGLPLKAGSRVGSCSLRREAQLRHYAPNSGPTPLRGNVPTRVEKLAQGKYDAILLAEAGVNRLQLDLSPFITFQLNPRRWMCAPGQGAVAVQCREDDAEVLSLLANLDDGTTRRGTGCEREFLRVLEGGCTTPFGCFVEQDTAWLGLSTENGWKSHQVSLPKYPWDSVWIENQLTHLSKSTFEENSDDWLTRRI